MRSQRSILERAGLASGLLTEEQIDKAWRLLAEASLAADLSLEEIDDEQLGAQLVALGYLNLWQAEQLRQGRTKFTLGPYRILDTIGQGGMGYVFKGEHVLLGRIEAIKVLPKNLTDPTSIANFRREIRAQAQLDHPNLVRLSFADQDGDTYFLVTEYVPGSDLRRLVHHHGALPQIMATLVISQTAEALQYAHSQGLIHRDVKPGNLLITPEGRTKLADLGLAFFSADTKTPSRASSKHIVGTADFLAPEVIVSPGNVRSISDIYSLGCTLYYAVTGKVPFPGGTTADKLRRQLDEAPLVPQRLNPQLDDALVDVMARMMAKRPEERIPTAAEVIERLLPWTSSADARTWKEIGVLAETSQKQSFRGASWAETLSSVSEQPETRDRQEDNTARLAQTPRVLDLPPAATKENGAPAALTSDDPSRRQPAEATRPPQLAGLGRATTALVALAIAAVLAVLLWVLSSVE